MNNKYAKTKDFEEPQFCEHVKLEREDAQKLGAKYSDKWGKASKWEFINKVTGESKIIQSASYNFFRDIVTQLKQQKIRTGDNIVVMNVSFPDPYDEKKNYRRWVVQKIWTEPGESVDYASKEENKEEVEDNKPIGDNEDDVDIDDLGEFSFDDDDE